MTNKPKRLFKISLKYLILQIKILSLIRMLVSITSFLTLVQLNNKI